MTYRLLATDLDGTLLNTKKEISPENAAAIQRALEEEKTIIFSTGRCLGEVKELMSHFSSMRYVICESGANVYDCLQNQLVYSRVIEREIAETILDYAGSRDIMIQIMLDGNSVIGEEPMKKLDYYRAPQYREHFQKTCVIVPDPVEYCRASDWKVGKFCLYHPNVEAREVTKNRFADLPVVMNYAEESMLEISPQGIDKGIGLEKLCDHLGIPLKETIVMGDSFNDLPILKKAGLSIAVDNAREEVKSACDVVVADNDHHGVKEAIETFLL